MRWSAVFPLNAAGEFTLQVTPAGAVPTAAQAILMLPVKLFTGVSVSEIAAILPAATVTFAVLDPVLFVKEKSGVTAVPDSDTALTDALLFRVRLPMRLPEAVGVKTTLTEQFALTASDAPQLLVSAKSPVAVKPVIAMGAFPVFVSVITCPGEAVPTDSWGKRAEQKKNRAVLRSGFAVKDLYSIDHHNAVDRRNWKP